MSQKMIGLVMSSMDSETALAMYEGIKNKAFEYNYSTQGYVIYPSDESSEIYNREEFFMLETIDYSQFDGLIVALNTISSESTRKLILDKIQQSDKPVVAIDCQIDGAYVINTSNYESVKEMIFHLIDCHGKSKINYLSGPLTNAEAVTRRQAYIDAMAERKLDYTDRIFEGKFFVEDGEKCLETFMAHGESGDFDAIVCGNDMQAISVISELAKRGIRVPEDVAVTGFDDVSDTVLVTPSVTTITKDISNVGSMAIDLLKGIWNGDKVPKTNQWNSKLVLRESCGCLAQKEIKGSIKARKLSNFKFEKLCHIYNRNFVEASTEARSFKEYLEVIKNFVGNINPGQFSMHIHEEYAKVFELENYPTVEVKLADGTSYNMINVLLYMGGTFIPLQQFSFAKNVEFDFEKAKQQMEYMPAVQFLNSPLHYLEKKIGFVAFGNSDFPTLPSLYFNWISSMNITINGIYNRMLLAQMYRTDDMTGAGNRSGMEYYWKKFSEIAEANNTTISVIFADINNLKIINDTYGHEDGDFAIKSLAKVLKSFENGRVRVIRYGGDEFLVFCLGYSEDEILDIKNQIKALLKDYSDKAAKAYQLSASLGSYIKHPDEKLSMLQCIEEADKAMYLEKQNFHKKDL